MYLMQEMISREIAMKAFGKEKGILGESGGSKKKRGHGSEEVPHLIFVLAIPNLRCRSYLWFYYKVWEPRNFSFFKIFLLI